MPSIPSRLRGNKPRRPHQGSAPDALDRQGHVMSAAEQVEQRKRKGLCIKCGIVQTHTFTFGVMRRPLTVNNEVYKGICLNCYSMTHARSILCEAVDANDFNHRGSVGHRPGTPAPNNSGRGGASHSAGSQGNGIHPGSNIGGSHPQDGPRRRISGDRSPGVNSNEEEPGRGSHPQDGPRRRISGDRSPGVNSNEEELGRGGRAVPPSPGTMGNLGRPDGDNNHAGEVRPVDDRRGEYFATVQEQDGRHGHVPDAILDDEMSVMSELTLDPAIANVARASLRDERQGSLGKIAEEHVDNGVSGSQGEEKAEQDHHSSLDNASHTRSHSGSASNGSGSNFDRLLARKLAANAPANERSGSGSASGSAATPVKRNSGNKGGQQAPQAAPAPPADTAHVNFRDEDVLTARGAQALRTGSIMEARIQAKQRADAEGAYARSNSDGNQASLPTGEEGHVRSRRPSDAIRGYEEHISDSVPKRTMSNEDAMEQFNSRYNQKVMMSGGSSDGSSAEDGKMRANHPSHKSCDVTPGAHSESNTGKYVTLLNRKMTTDGASTGGKYKDDQVQTHGATHDPLSDSDARSLIDDCSCCSEVMDVLKRSSSSSEAIVVEALTKLRKFLSIEHGLAGDATSSHHSMSMDSIGASGRPKIAFFDGGWAKVIMMVMSSHSSKSSVQAELLLTLWSTVTMNPRYATDLTSGATMEPVVATMETHSKEERIQKYGCGLLACIAATEKHAQRLMSFCDGKIVNRLMAALYVTSPGGNVQENALKALLRLSSASLSTKDNTTPMKPFADRMGRCAQDDQKLGDPSVDAIVAVRNAMGRHLENSSVQIYGNSLLWNIFNPAAISDQDNVDIQMQLTLNHIKSAMMSHPNSQAFHESIICLLSKISRIPSCFGIKLPESFLFAVVTTMESYPNSSVVALHGCRCLADVCLQLSSKEEAAKEELVGGIPAVVACMDTFEERISIQLEACATISALCINCPSNKERVHQLGAIDKIIRAYDSYSMTPYEGHWLITKIRACTALTSLALDPIVLSDIQDKGIIIKFSRLIEEDQQIPETLQHAIQRMLNLAAEVENLDTNLVFQEGASEDETCGCLRANLRVMHTPDFIPNRVSYLRSNAVKAMQVFRSSSGVHEDACKLLACAFALASQAESIAPGDAVSELETITDSLARHKNEPRNAEAACSALQNFCIMLSLSNSNDCEGLNNHLSSAVVEVVGVIIIFREDEQTLEQASGALMALCAMREGLALKFENDSTIGIIVGAMTRFPDSVNLQKYLVGILGSFFSVSSKILDFLSDDLVTVVIKFIDAEVERGAAPDYVDIAVNIILITSQKGYLGITALLRNSRMIDSIVSCMWKWPNDLLIQSAGIVTLPSLAIDHYLITEICQRGGTSRILCALDNLKDDPLLVCKAYAALGNLVSAADVEILRSHDAPASRIMVSALTTHPQDLSVQVGGAYALMALSAKNDSFKDEIVNLGGAEVIANAMRDFVGSKQIQEKGFHLIWSLAVPKHLKTRVGRCAAEPAVMGLNAHLASEKICENALGCLKVLSTITVNKELLEENGVIDSIYACIWRHSENHTVCRAALAALCNITVNVDTNVVSVITSDDLDAILNTMRSHLRVREVQKGAIILLRNFTFSPPNFAVLGQNPYVVGLIRTAMANFNENFDGRADDLLRVLPTPGHQ